MNFITGVYRNKQYIYSVLCLVSGIHWGSWSIYVPPADMGDTAVIPHTTNFSLALQNLTYAIWLVTYLTVFDKNVGNTQCHMCQ